MQAMMQWAQAFHPVLPQPHIAQASWVDFQSSSTGRPAFVRFQAEPRLIILKIVEMKGAHKFSSTHKWHERSVFQSDGVPVGRFLGGRLATKFVKWPL